MDAPVAEKLMTAEEFYPLPKPHTGERLELVKGEIAIMSPPGGVYGVKAAIISSALYTFSLQRQLGEVFVETGFTIEFDPDTVRAPDVSFLSAERIPEDGLPEGFIPGAPDLAVEIVSPGDLDSDVQDKVMEYLSNGTRRVWVVRPRTRTVTVHNPDGAAHTLSIEDTLSSDDAAFAVSGFSLPLHDLFA